MRISPVLFILGKILLVLGVSMLLPLAVALHYGEGDAISFAYSIIPTLLCGAILLFFCRRGAKTVMRQREGFLFVSLVWLAAAFFGALPYWFGGLFRGNFIDALFESMSGFATVGASALSNIEAMPKGMLFWWSMTLWLGGAGIVMLFVAFLRGKDGSGMGAQVFNAENPGADLIDKITPRVGDGAKALFFIYIGITFSEAVLLLGGGLDLFDALVHTFATVSTGGFSSRNMGIAYYDSAYVEWVIIVFMFFSSINFGLYYQLFIRNRAKIIHDEEARVFTIICLVAIALVTANLVYAQVYASQGLGYIIRQAAFQVVSVTTSSGFATENYLIWPPFARCLVFLLVFVGGTVGSTASSIKVSRLIIAFKAMRYELLEMVHPRLVKKLYFNKKPVSQGTVKHVLIFIAAFCFFTLAGALLLTLSGLDIKDALSTSLACISNIGPGLGGLCAPLDYTVLNIFGKCVMLFNMMIGRLEIFTVLVLFLPSVWKR
ncbi:MAG: TrkH family potassium uptake protein [Clostridiales bacterium]|nr:TrkH family potassium uptake protein [Clostridiales bacterium]